MLKTAVLLCCCFAATLGGEVVQFHRENTTFSLLKGSDRYYLNVFFKADWYTAFQFCRSVGLQLVSINSQYENNILVKDIADAGLLSEEFWTSGTDQAEEGSFVWMSTGRPLGYKNWSPGQPDNVKRGCEYEDCLELLYPYDVKGIQWNDAQCSIKKFFICEESQN